MSELEKTVADILVKATNAAEAAGKFAMEQLPDIAQQYVLFKGGWALIETVLLMLTWIAMYTATIKYLAYMKRERISFDDIFPAPFFVGMGMTFWVAASAIGIWSNLQTSFLAFFAPKILLIQWAAQLAK